MRQQLLAPAFLWAVLALSLVLGSAASAEEVKFSLDAEGEYNSNILGSANNEIGSFVSRIGPDLEIRDPYGKLTYLLAYTGDFTWYADAKNIDAFQHHVNLTAAYALSQKTKVSVRESFRDQSNIRFDERDQADLADTLDGGLDQFLRNVFSTTLDHRFTRRISARLTVNNEQLDYANDHSHTDSTFMGTDGSFFYMLSSRNSVGAGGGFTYQKYEAAGNSLASQGSVWNSYLTWIHRFESEMTFTIQGGPSAVSTNSSGRIRTDRFLVTPHPTFVGVNIVKTGPCSEASPEFAGGFYEDSCTDLLTTATGRRGNIALLGTNPSQSRLTFFGKASLVRRWEGWEFRAAYTRQESGASGDEGTSALDRALVSANYEVDRLWSFYFSTGWSRRERLTRSPLIQRFIVVSAPSLANPRVAATTQLSRSRASKSTQYNVTLQTKRRLTKNLDARASFAYRKQLRDRAAGAQSIADYYIFRVALSYVFDPVRF